MRHFSTRILTAVILLQAGVASLSGQELENGIYRVPDELYHSKQLVLDAKDVKIGERYLPVPKTITLESLNNGNTDYLLSFTWVGTPRPGILAVVVGGKCLPFTYSSGGPEGSNDQFEDALHLSDPEIVRQVAALFKIKAYPRKHPGHEFTSEFIVKPEGCPLSGPFPVTFKLTNYGNVPMCFPKCGGASGDRDLFYPNPFTFTANRHGRDNFKGEINVPEQPRKEDMSAFVLIHLTVPPPDLGRITLQPGQAYSVELNLATHLKLDKPGTYNVRGTFHFALFDPALSKPGKGPLSGLILWDDYASDQFKFVIEGP